MEKMGLEVSLKSFYEGKKVFITGHTGFKGAWLLTWLTSLGAIVKGFALPQEEPRALFNKINNNIEFENFYGDIRNKTQLKEAILSFEPDIIFHLAAQALVKQSYIAPTETHEVNIIGTCNLLESLITLNKKCTVIVITTDKVYENKEKYYNYKETDRLGGYDPYSASKAAAELMISSFRNSFFNRNTYNSHQKAIVAARAGNVIGGGDWSVNRIVPDIINALILNKEIEVRNPSSIRPWQHVLEPLAGYLQLAKLSFENYKNVGDAYNFGPENNDHLTVEKLVTLATKYWGDGIWINSADANAPHEAQLLMLDITKAKNELNWIPKLKSEEAIKWTINWYKLAKENELNFVNMQIENYYSL